MPDRCSAGADGWECAACGRKDSSRFSAAAVPEGSLSGGYGICNGGMPEGVPRGRRMKVLINLQWCKGCGVCVAFCRSGALSLDGDGKPEYAPALCVGCGLCELYCPDLAVECLGEDGPGESGEGA